MSLEECRREVEAWLSLKLNTGRTSALLTDELARHMMGRTLDVFSIYDEIGRLERTLPTRSPSSKPAAQFTGKTLAGLWHKHYFSPTFLMRNIVNHWTPGRLTSLHEEIDKDEALCDAEKAKLLSHRIVIDGFQARSRARRLTGEWIVFARHAGANVYLTLASHTEADEGILARVKQAATEFPELEL